MPSQGSEVLTHVGPLSLPLSKFSYATVSGDSIAPVPWIHLSSKSNLFAVFEKVRVQDVTGHVEDRRKFKVVQDPHIMEEIDLDLLAAEAKKAIVDLRVSGPSEKGPRVTIIVKKPCIAIRYPRSNGQVRRFQIRFTADEDYFEAMKWLARAQVPVTEAGTFPTPHGPLRPSSSSSSLLRPDDSISQAGCRQASASSHFASGNSNTIADTPSGRPSSLVPRPTTSSSNMMAGSPYPASFAKQHVGHFGSIQSAMQDDQYSGQTPRSLLETSLESPYFNTLTVEPDHAFHRPVSPRLDTQSLVQPSYQDPEIDMYEPRPSTAPTLNSQHLSQMLPPKRNLPFLKPKVKVNEAKIDIGKYQDAKANPSTVIPVAVVSHQLRSRVMEIDHGATADGEHKRDINDEPEWKKRLALDREQWKDVEDAVERRRIQARLARQRRSERAKAVGDGERQTISRSPAGSMGPTKTSQPVSAISEEPQFNQLPGSAAGLETVSDKDKSQSTHTSSLKRLNKTTAAESRESKRPRKIAGQKASDSTSVDDSAIPSMEELVGHVHPVERMSGKFQANETQVLLARLGAPEASDTAIVSTRTKNGTPVPAQLDQEVSRESLVPAVSRSRSRSSSVVTHRPFTRSMSAFPKSGNANGDISACSPSPKLAKKPKTKRVPRGAQAKAKTSEILIRSTQDSETAARTPPSARSRRSPEPSRRPPLKNLDMNVLPLSATPALAAGAALSPQLTTTEVSHSLRSLLAQPDFAPTPALSLKSSTSSLAAWAALPEAQQQRALEVWMCQQFQNADFVALCKTIDGTWQRLMMGV